MLKSKKVIIVHDHIRQLGIKFLLVEMLVDFLQICEECIFFQLEVNETLGKPGM
jgi:hypothetical protein